MSPESKQPSIDNERHVRVEAGERPAHPDTTDLPYPEPVKGSKATTIQILFLAANPSDTTTLKLDEEIERIQGKIRPARFGKLFVIQKQSCVRVDHLQGLLMEHRPDIVHFSGHGSVSSEIVLEDKDGRSHAVSIKALSDLFFLLSHNVRFVVLNACYSEQQAREIANHIEWVIGMSNAILDSSAIAFAGSLYQALAYGYSVRQAFALARHEIDLTNVGEADKPKLLGPDINATVFPESNKVTQTILSVSDSKRLQAAKELTAVPQKHLTSLLIQRSSADPNGSVRYWLNRALGKVPSAAAIRTLRKNLNDPEPFARLGAEDALEECGEDLKHAGDSTSSHKN
jgi:hypothetical protein